MVTSNLHICYSGCPQGRPCKAFGRVSIFLFFVVASNLHINLFIKLCSLLEGIYYSDCLQQKRPNQNPLSARISRRRGPTYPYLLDPKANHHLQGCFSMAACMNLTLWSAVFGKKTNVFQAENRKNNFKVVLDLSLNGGNWRVYSEEITLWQTDRMRRKPDQRSQYSDYWCVTLQTLSNWCLSATGNRGKRS